MTRRECSGQRTSRVPYQTRARAGWRARLTPVGHFGVANRHQLIVVKNVEFHETHVPHNPELPTASNAARTRLPYRAEKANFDASYSRASRHRGRPVDPNNVRGCHQVPPCVAQRSVANHPALHQDQGAVVSHVCAACRHPHTETRRRMTSGQYRLPSMPTTIVPSSTPTRR